ncbi:DUF6844 domain-containing protein [Alkalilimnicola sp. S0819]|uniref:DUF6844 domain-containing protein n=1 Tax=Alkalilimnicola sp. S0819 TaxID=2613922 RepID=UPI001261D906|nr:hypothetical protein [Alkalilimnicola sp. S0819]KAB7624115.1 hypothetical protein F3N43_06925 [Alkalilimnicola sp. S0819]MPQ16367.1 hypothetical protein [Alkalilimnicola sp. S0819]
MINALLAATLIAAPAAWAEGGRAQPAGAEPAVMADVNRAAEPPAEPVDPNMELQSLINAWETNGAGAAFLRRASRNELFYTTASASVMARPEHRQWADFRASAYDEALLKAKAKYMVQQGVTTTAEQVRELFDNGNQMPDFSPEELRSNSRLMAVLNKAVGVASGKLDEQLRELGMDPSEFKAAPPEKRATLFRRAVTSREISRARATLDGVIVVKTFEAHNANGDHAVAVAIVASPKFRARIDNLVSSRGEVSPSPERARGEPLKAYMQAHRKGLMNEFGVRHMYDDQGYPVLISYGQAGNPYQGEDFQRRADQREVAFASAKSTALANFAYLINSSGTNRESQSTTASRATEGVARHVDGVTQVSEESYVEYIRQLDSSTTVRGRMNDLPGITELYRWTEKHPLYGHEINGVVYLWHPRSEQLARDIRGQNAGKASSKPAQRTKGSAGTVQSMDSMDSSDF